jgi:release factor glutamine methyltransferase
MTHVARALAAARGKIVAAEARLLLGYVMQRSAAWLLTHDEAELDEAQLTLFASLCARRHGGEPIAYLITRREFYGREFFVAPGVLIPRPETELLVDIALEKVGAGKTARILDLGTGSGCIAISIALERPDCTVTAVDISPVALQIAARNAATLRAPIELLASDWYAALDGRRFDVIVANPPYIRDANPHLSQGDLVHEPAAALASGEDGFDALRKIIVTAPHHLDSGGELWLEHGYDQAEAVAELLCRAGLRDIAHRADLAGIARVSGGRIG